MDNQSPLQGSPRQPAVTVGEDEFLMPGHVLSVASQQSVSANVPAFEQLGMSPALFAGFAGAYSDVHGKPKGSCSSCAGETPTVHPSAIEPPPIMRAVRPEVTPQQARQVEHPPQMRPTREHVGGRHFTLLDTSARAFMGCSDDDAYGPAVRIGAPERFEHPVVGSVGMSAEASMIIASESEEREETGKASRARIHKEAARDVARAERGVADEHRRREQERRKAIEELERQLAELQAERRRHMGS